MSDKPTDLDSLFKATQEQDAAYQKGRAYERKRIMDIIKTIPLCPPSDQEFIEELEEKLKEPHKD